MSRPASAHEANERIADVAARLRFVSRLPLYCECSDPDCEELVLMELDAYREAAEAGRYLTAAGHTVAGAEPDRKEPGYWLHRRRTR